MINLNPIFTQIDFDELKEITTHIQFFIDLYRQDLGAFPLKTNAEINLTREIIDNLKQLYRKRFHDHHQGHSPSNPPLYLWVEEDSGRADTDTGNPNPPP